MTEALLTADILLFAPLRGDRSSQRNVEGTLRALQRLDLSVVVMDTSTSPGRPLHRRHPLSLLHLLGQRRTRLGVPGGHERAQLSIVLGVCGTAVLPSEIGAAMADSAVVVLDGYDAQHIERIGLEQALVDELSPRLDGFAALSNQVAVASSDPAARTAARALANDRRAALLDELWNFSIDETSVRPGARTRSAEISGPAGAIRIGRHQHRPEPHWPQSHHLLHELFPTDGSFRAAVFGPHARLRKRLGEDAQSVTFRTAVASQDLESLDFWVPVLEDPAQIVRDPALYEAFAAALPVVLPPACAPTFGDAAIYAEPTDVRQVLIDCASDPAAYQTVSRASLEYARAMTNGRLADQLEALGVGRSSRAMAPAERVLTPREGRARYRVAFVTSNGAGMGHLTRLLAVARKLPDDVEAIFISLSQAVPVVEQYGFPFVYIASKNETGMSPAAWNAYAQRRFTEEFARYAPDLAVFDGTWPYKGLMQALRDAAVPAVWSRRGMWKEEVHDRALSFSDRFQAIIEPGEFAAEADRGATRTAQDAHPVAPVTVLDRRELLTKSAARRSLGIPDGARAVLLTLGAGNLNDTNSVTATFVEAFRNLEDNWHVVLTSNPISAHSSSYRDVQTIQAYPIALYARAFDLVVSAAGYNSFHEWTMACVPTIWLPNTSTQTDDQVARAEYAAAVDCGYCLVDPEAEKIHQCVQQATRWQSLRQQGAALQKRQHSNGATTFARSLSYQLRTGQAPEGEHT